MQNMPIGIFKGDDTDAFSYQTIVGTINTDLDLTGCKAVFRYLGFSMEFDPIPEDRKLTIVIPADETKKFPPGLGYASLRVYDSDGRLKTFSNRIMVFVATKTPMFGSDEFEVDFNVRASLEPLKFFVGPNPDDFDEYRGYLEKVIDRASAAKYGLSILLDAIDSDLGANDGVAATPVAVKAAYAAIVEKLTDDYYTAEQTDEAIDRVAAYYITYDAAGNPFPTYASLANAQTVYSGGQVRTPTRNDYCVVLADETHGGAEYRYIYAVAEGETTGSWQPQFPVEGVMTVDPTVTRNSQNPVSGGGVWSAIWGALTALPTGFSSLYDWCVSQLAGKLDKNGGTITGNLTTTGEVTMEATADLKFNLPRPRTLHDLLSGKQPELSDVQLANIAAVSDALAFDATRSYAAGDPVVYDGTLYTFTVAHTGAWTGDDVSAVDIISRLAGKLDKSGDTMTGDLTMSGAAIYAYASGSQAPGAGIDGNGVMGNTFTTQNVSLSSLKFTILADQTYTVRLPFGNGVLALTAGTGHTGNLAALDARGNPTDSLIPVANVAVKGEIPYILVTKTIDNGAVSLDDRAINAVAVSSSLASLTVNFPTATSGKARDFGLRLTVASGVTTAPQIVLPQGVTCENADGEAPEIGADGAATILYFTETASGVFLVKGEVLQTITA